MSTTRFPNGVTNARPNGNLSNMGQLDPFKYFTVYEDFGKATSAFGADATAAAGDGGLVTLATTKAAVTPAASFVLNASKSTFVKFRFSLSAIASSTITFGLADSLGTPTKGAYFTLVNGTTLNFILKGAGTSTTTFTVAVANGVMTTIGYAYTPNKGFKIYSNGAVVGTVTDITNLDQATSLLFGLLSTGPTTTLDYLLAAKER